ncbi:MAG: Dihydroorotate dehydrogenase B (NAD(+)), electron transfer subunit [Syntrophomonadaceae bacterium]|nr:Dihydroorotate dehydrogenase B (NAD(+)), electron transfer subunit [Bacillota bacterium]
MTQLQRLSVRSHEQVAPGVFLLCLSGGLTALPGQFVMVSVLPDSVPLSLRERPGEGFEPATALPACDPLLRRPLSVHDCRPGELVLLYRVAGRGTVLLAGRKPGDSVDVLGPLGQGFPLSASRQAILVAGGIGVAPLFYLARTLLEAGREVLFLFGAGEQAGLYRRRELALSGAEVRLATDDGSAGFHGPVTGLLREALGRNQGAVFACGPEPMLQAVAELCRAAERECIVSLEARMACGVGACLGCVVPVRRHGLAVYRRTCTEGPVFRAEEVYSCNPTCP